MATRPKEDLKNDIYNRLRGDTRTASSDIKVAISDSTATLSGTVSSLNIKELASVLTWRVEGVKKVENRIEIRLPTDYLVPPDDAQEEKIRLLISTDPDLFRLPIEITVDAGNVTISGTVKNNYEKNRINQIVHSIGGIIGVFDKLVVVPTSRVSDEVLGRQIIERITQFRAAEINNITLNIVNGSVTISGIVEDKNEFDTIEDIIRYTDGVTEIKNQLIFSK